MDEESRVNSECKLSLRGLPIMLKLRFDTADGIETKDDKYEFNREEIKQITSVKYNLPFHRLYSMHH